MTDKKPLPNDPRRQAELQKFIRYHLGHYGPKDLKNLFPGINLNKVTKK